MPLPILPLALAALTSLSAQAGEVPAVGGVSLDYEHRFRQAYDRHLGETNYPSGVAVDSKSGDVYVMDLYYQQVTRWSAEGKALKKWKVKGGLGMHVDPDTSELWVAMRHTNKVNRYNRDGELLGTIGKTGKGPGQFDTPIDITMDSKTGKVYVLEHGNLRVQVLDKAGKHLSFIELDLRKPFGISMHPGGDFLIIANTGNRELIKLTPEGETIERWYRPGSAPGEFRWPRNVAVRKDGTILVADTDNERGQLLDADGNFIRWVQGPNDRTGGAFHPRAVDVNLKTGDIYYAAAYAHRVDRFNAKGDFVSSMGEHDKDGPFLNQPQGIAVLGEGDILVSDWLDHRIKTYSLEGELKANFDCWIPEQTMLDGTPVTEAYAADPLTGMWVIKEYLCFPAPLEPDGEGGFWMVRGSMHYDDDPRLQADQVIRRFKADGTFVAGITHETFPRDARMRDLSADPAAKALYVANSGGNRVMSFGYDGSLKWSVGADEAGAGKDRFDYPTGVAVDPAADRIFVADSGNDRIVILDTAGTYLGEFGGPGKADGQLDLRDFCGIALDPRGLVFVEDGFNNRIQVFDYTGKHLLSHGAQGYGSHSKYGGLTSLAVHGGKLFVLDQTGKDVERFNIIVQ